MGAALWGCLSALSFGGGDFMARFSTRALGAPSAYAVILIIGNAALTAWVLASGVPFVWSAEGLSLIVVHGVGVTVMTVLLYICLARGPISVVAPIIASHPVLVVLFAVAGGGRPGGTQWLAMAIIVTGVVLLARFAEQEAGPSAEARTERAKTIGLAGAACFTYATMIIAGQAAVPLMGELQTTWIGRWVALAVLALFFIVRRQRPTVSVRWIPFLALQGLLDVGGYLALFAGSHTDHPEIAAVAASTFGVVTVILAWLILKETIRTTQWLAMAMIFAGIAVLATEG
jgi:drug/metabolite transporter (DMT)-like permease